MPNFDIELRLLNGGDYSLIIPLIFFMGPRGMTLSSAVVIHMETCMLPHCSGGVQNYQETQLTLPADRMYKGPKHNLPVT